MAAEAKVPAEAVHKEYSAEKTDIDDVSGETKEVDLTSVAKETADAEDILKEDSGEEIDTDDGSVETKEVDLTAVAKASPETEAVLDHNFAEETDTDEEIDVTGEAQVTAETVLKEDCAGRQTRMWSLVKRRRLFDGCSKGINRSSSLRTFCRGKRHR